MLLESAVPLTNAESPTVPGTAEALVEVHEPVERYSMELHRGRAVRRVLDRQGREHLSSVELPVGAVSFLSPVDAFDSAWLRTAVAPQVPSQQAVSVADLFSGCGGLTVGVVEACRALGLRVEHALAVDTDEDALAVYAHNYPCTPIYADPVETLVDGELGESLTSTERQLADRLAGLTLAVGGPPCQGNSDLNNHTRRADPKNLLYLRMVRFVEVVRPQHVVIENVPGVAHDRHGVVSGAISALERIGYQVSAGVVPAVTLGVPQMRRRHLLLATLTGQAEPKPDVASLKHRYSSPARPVLWAIDDLDEDLAGGAFDTAARHAAINRQRIEYLFENGLYDLPNEQRPDCHRLKPHSYTAVYGRMHPDRPAPTITSGFGSTGQGRFVHPHRPRTLTPHEAARLQGFPDYFSFAPATGRRALQRMIGNAVPSRLGYAAALDLLR